MEFFEFFRQILILLIIISLYFPLNVPLAALAYKVRNGPKPMPLTHTALWLRSFFAAVGMFVISFSLMGFDATMAASGMAAGVVHVVMFLLYLPLGTWWMFKIFALEDMWEGLSTLLLYVFLPGFVLVVIQLISGSHIPHYLNVQEWIVEVPA